MFNLPTPSTTIGRLVERAILTALAILIGGLISEVKLSPVIYFALKSALDIINKNIPNM